MSIYLDKTEEQLKSEIEGKDVVIWGAGEAALKFMKHNPWIAGQIKFFVDMDPEKQNGMLYGKRIYETKKLFEEEVDVCILASQFYEPMVDEIKRNGFSGDVYWGFFMNYEKDWRGYKMSGKHKSDLKKVLEDDRSREIVDFIETHRIMKDLRYGEIGEGNQYFVRDIVKKEKDAVFVDAGAYDGDTAKQFIEFQDGLYDSIYCFEMDRVNYELLKKNVSDINHLHCLNYGLWNEKTEMRYSVLNTSSSLDDNAGEEVAKCTTLDEVLQGKRVSFIKMDIEGAEIQALQGAKESILKWKPQLAICLYHKPDDLWQIPLMIHEWVPEYKLYIRHHTNIQNETVLYAVCED